MSASKSALPEKARVVIIGGGVIGCSVAYHLAKLGWKDVVLLERKQLTSGTTWHAAGLIAQLRATANMTKLAKYSQELYGTLEAETGVATGFKRVGSITVALTEERREEIYRQAGMARAFGVEVEEISNKRVKELYPHINLDGIKGAVYLPLNTAYTRDEVSYFVNDASPKLIVAGPEVADLRRPGGRRLDREHEHGAGRQQEAVSDERRGHPDVAAHDHAVRDHGSLAGLGTSSF